MTSVRFGVIADDLTGASELAGIALEGGVRSTVYLDWKDIPETGSSIPVLNTDSRHCSPLEASSRVKEAATALRESGCNCFYKKCDSVLRGNIGAELVALLEACAGERLIYGPAFPSAGRVVKSGQLLVEGMPVAASVFANDPLSPVSESQVSAIIRKQSGSCQVTEANLSSKILPSGIVIFDGESDEDLWKLRFRCDNERYFGGPGLFFRVLISAFTLPREPPPLFTLPRNWLVTIGSQHPATLNQLEALMKAGSECLQLLPSHLMGHFEGSVLPDGWAERAQQAWLKNRCVVLHTARNVKEITAYQAVGKAKGMTREVFSRELTHVLTKATVQLASNFNPGMLLCGGETAQSLTQFLRLDSLEALQAPANGVTLLRGKSPTGEYLIMTKNGAFGSNNLLVSLMEKMG